MFVIFRVIDQGCYFVESERADLDAKLVFRFYCTEEKTTEPLLVLQKTGFSMIPISGSDWWIDHKLCARKESVKVILSCHVSLAQISIPSL